MEEIMDMSTFELSKKTKKELKGYGDIIFDSIYYLLIKTDGVIDPKIEVLKKKLKVIKSLL